MRFDSSTGKSAVDIINTYQIVQLVEIFTSFADIPPKSAQMLAQLIVDQRKKKPISSVEEFVAVMNTYKRSYTLLPQIFQALRIQTNDELKHLEEFLHIMPDYLAR